MVRHILMLVVLVTAVGMPHASFAQRSSDVAEAARVAEELSYHEATGDFNALYDRIHPDAHAVVPRAAVIGWYETDFAPRGPGVATVTGVRFVTWTWAVTGQTYPYTAEVSFVQPLADGSVIEDVVRLVKDGNGEWRWFFGRSREFVDDQIARFALLPPPVTSRTSPLQIAVADLDAFWTTSFAAGGGVYTTPRVVTFDRVISTGCGPYVDPLEAPAFYCGIDQTIYLYPGFIDWMDANIGDFAWMTVMAHEWGHHVQRSLGIRPGSGSRYELQADCLAGAYSRDAETRGLLDPGDITEAVLISAISGDSPSLPRDAPGSHGTDDQRIAAFMRGYLDGFIGCNLPIAQGTGSAGATNANGLLVTGHTIRSSNPAGASRQDDASLTLASRQATGTDAARMAATSANPHA